MNTSANKVRLYELALENGRSGVALGNALRVLKGLGLTLVPKERR